MELYIYTFLSFVVYPLEIYYMAKRKQGSPCCQGGNAQLYRISDVELAFPFSGIKGPKPVPAWQCPCTQRNLNADMVCQVWCGRT